MRHQGVLKSWQPDKGFGFIASAQKHATVFVHIRDIENRPKNLRVGVELTYQLGKDQKGRDCAIAVKLAHPVEGGKQFNFRASVVLLFAGALAVLLILGLCTPYLLVWYVLIGLMTYWQFCQDKRAAQNDRWRTPENTLQFMSLIGGWPGALLAQQRIRHKSRKLSFNVMLWLGIMAHLAGLVWLLMPSGQHWLRQFTGL